MNVNIVRLRILLGALAKFTNARENFSPDKIFEQMLCAARVQEDEAHNLTGAATSLLTIALLSHEWVYSTRTQTKKPNSEGPANIVQSYLMM